MSELDLIFSRDEIKDTTISYKGVEFKLKVRDLTWAEKNQILSKCMVYDKDGGMALNYHTYVKEALKKIVVEAPWGKTDEIFFTRVNSSFGSELEKLVPKSFTEPESASFFGKEPSP